MKKTLIGPILMFLIALFFGVKAVFTFPWGIAPCATALVGAFYLLYLERKYSMSDR